MYSLLVTSDAELDIIAAVDYYDAISPALGKRFINALSYAYSKLSEQPRYYKYTRKQRANKLRCIRIKSFPYLVIFNVLASNEVIIIAVLNTYWKTRYF